jgi:hypothetical protein
MNTDGREEKLDKLLTQKLRGKLIEFDFDKWKQTHKKEVEIFESQTAGRQISHSVQPFNIWRIIMKGPITKIAVAAAVIIVVVLIGTHPFSSFVNLTTPAYGVTDLPGLFERAKVIHTRGWQYFPGHKMPGGKEIPPVEINNWIDLEDGRSRYTGSGLSSDTNGVRITMSETISEGQYSLCLNHTDKNAIFLKISDYQRMMNAYQISKLMHGQILGEVEQLENFAKIGQEEIDGVTYDIWQGEMIQTVTKHANRFKFWLSPSCGKLGRVQSWAKVNDDQWELNYEFCDIDYNVVVPDGVFAMEIPQDYALRNTKETAIPLELGSEGGAGCSDNQYDLFVNTRVSFTMSDGSVILGWHSADRKSETPQDKLFEGLEFGGAPPKLPVEIYGLAPGGVPSDITYTGRHLTCTKKADQFIEWGLYVPNGTPPTGTKKLGYDVLYRFNLEQYTPKCRIGLTVKYGIPIETSGDFDKWVLGAMAELSDDGEAPADVTYTRVLQLAEKIRKSLSK